MKRQNQEIAISGTASLEHRSEAAILFLAEALSMRRQSGKKPVLLHSIRVGSRLLALGYGTNVVIAGLLHDILEKTLVTHDQIARRFGEEVGALVACVTNDRHITDPIARYVDSIKRCRDHGCDALAIRAVDLIDNCDRLTALLRLDRLPRIRKKLELIEPVAWEQGLNKKLIADIVLRINGTTHANIAG